MPVMIVSRMRVWRLTSVTVRSARCRASARASPMLTPCLPCGTALRAALIAAPTIMVPPPAPCPLRNRRTVTWTPSAFVFAGPDVERHHIGVGACRRAPAARLLPVGLLAQQRLTEPVELGDHLLCCRADRVAGPLVKLLQLPGHLLLDVGGHL